MCRHNGLQSVCFSEVRRHKNVCARSSPHRYEIASSKVCNAFNLKKTRFFFLVSASIRRLTSQPPRKNPRRLQSKPPIAALQSKPPVAALLSDPASSDCSDHERRTTVSERIAREKREINEQSENLGRV
ncbi:uncharacterized protein LOC122195068 [Lactuca sativa]|uniref:uncharacterized protein LOC122195068 n=1 Tax=Lactuca sativa TaxID=4236 RepID=UPI001C68AF7C|nr:uncharacterized protein LOC122195068 [Lactuca sativa]